MIRLQVANKVFELDAGAPDLIDHLRRVGQFRRADDGEMVPVTASARAATKLRDAVQSREIVRLDDEELGAVRHVIEHWANESRGGFDALPPDVVALRHAIADRTG